MWFTLEWSIEPSRKVDRFEPKSGRSLTLKRFRTFSNQTSSARLSSTRATPQFKESISSIYVYKSTRHQSASPIAQRDSVRSVKSVLAPCTIATLEMNLERFGVLYGDKSRIVAFFWMKGQFSSGLKCWLTTIFIPQWWPRSWLQPTQWNVHHRRYLH